MNKENRWLTPGVIGAIIGLIVIRSLLDYIKENNLSDIYMIAIGLVIALVCIIGAVRIGKKNRKMNKAILLCISIVGFILLDFLLDFIRSSYPQYVHIFKAPIIIGMILSAIFGTLIVFSFSNQN